LALSVAHFPPPLGRKTFEKANIEFYILMLTRKTQGFQRARAAKNGEMEIF